MIFSTYALRIFLFVSGLIFLPLISWSHGDEKHVTSPKKETSNDDPQHALPIQSIKTSYEKNVEPILSKKCFDCHSDQTKYPWYYVIPGVKQLINHDINEAREHLDMSEGYPFKGHHSAIEQLEDIEKVVKKNKMPLWYYRIMHWDSQLTKEEKATILEWVREGLKDVPVKNDDHD